MKYILLLATLFLCSCTTCVPDEKVSCSYNCNRDGYSVDYSEEVIDD